MLAGGDKKERRTARIKEGRKKAVRCNRLLPPRKGKIKIRKRKTGRGSTM